MKIIKLANFLEKKYPLRKAAADMTFNEIRSALRGFRETWLDGAPGKKTPDQSFLAWLDLGVKDESNNYKYQEFQDMDNLVSLVRELSVHPSLTPMETFDKVKEVLRLSKLIKDDHLGKIKSALIRSNRSLRKTDLKEYDHREMKIRTFLRHLDSVYEKLLLELRDIVSAHESRLSEEGMSFKPTEFSYEGGYEKQKPRPLSEQEVIHFIDFYPERAERFGLGDKEIVSKMLTDFQLKDLVDAVIRAAQRGHIPRRAPEAYLIHDSLSELKRKLLENNADLFEADEDVAKQKMTELKDPEDLEELAKSQWSQEMLQRKEEKAEELKNQKIMEEAIRLRDLEHEKRMKEKLLEKEKEEEMLKSKYSHLTRIFKKYQSY